MAQNPVVTITMEDGSVMKAELYPEIAPNTVNNFISLINLAHMRKAAHRIDSAAKGFLRQQIVIINLLA